MTNSVYWARIGALSLIIGTMSACAAGPGLPTSAAMPFRTQATASGSDSTGEPQATEAAKQYAKGFKAGYADCSRAQKSDQERQEYLRLHAKYGDRYTFPDNKSASGSQPAAAADKPASPPAAAQQTPAKECPTKTEQPWSCNNCAKP